MEQDFRPYNNNVYPKAEDILSAAGSVNTEQAVESVMQLMATGPMDTAIGSSFYGINHRVQPGAITINRDFHGLTFFTRPRLNLETDNLRNVRLFSELLTSEAKSPQRIIRCLLDPELARKSTPISSPYVDSELPFIPMLTNHLLSINGWPDLDAPTFQSHEGIYKESFALIDGVVENYSTYDITANFRNIPGDPITSMIFYWLHYAAAVYLNHLVPYPDMILRNEIDYQTRIYRLVLDHSKSKVQKISACLAAFPVSCPIGAAFNYDATHPLNQSNDQVSINFKCSGAIYNDPILIYEFNNLVEEFNPAMTDAHRASSMKLIPLAALGIFNNRGYPRINPETMDLEWWIDNATYNYFLPAIETNTKLTGVKN